jgi:sporulation protein YlmC with PRC-barrel domain
VSERQDRRGPGPENRLAGSIDGALHLLDRQILDCNGEMLGKVDDVELLDTSDGLTIAAVLTGPAAWWNRLGGKVGGVLTDRWRRMRISEPDREWPWGIDFDDVERLDSALHLSVPREGLLRRNRPEHRLGDLTGMDVVVDDEGRIGRVLDARFAPGPKGALTLTSLIVGHGRPGTLLGYDRRGDQGPWLVRTLVRRLHRHSAIVDADAAQIDWEDRQVRLQSLPTDPPNHAFD